MKEASFKTKKKIELSPDLHSLKGFIMLLVYERLRNYLQSLQVHQKQG